MGELQKNNQSRNFGIKELCYFRNKDTGTEIKINVRESNYLKLTSVKGAF